VVVLSTRRKGKGDFIPKILVPLAEGFEEIEALAVVDILRRAGIDVVTMGMIGNIVTSSHKVRMHADERLIAMEDFSKYDGVVLPGGSPGYENLMRSEKVLKIVDAFAKSGRLVGAICGAPAILVKLGLLKDKRATAHPDIIKSLDKPRGDKVVVDGNIITSQGPGTAVEFALRIVEHLLGKAKASQVRQNIVA